jgi:hypothetical protein
MRIAFPLAVSPNLTDLDFLCESSSPISTIGTPVSLAGSSTAPVCQPAPIVPFGFEPHVTLMPVPLSVPRVPPGFPPCVAVAPSAPQITAAGGQTTPYIEAGGSTAPSGGPTT